MHNTLGKLYRHSEVLKIYPSLRSRTLISWSEKKYFIPEVKPSGPGSRRQYSLKNLVEVGVIFELVKHRAQKGVILNVMNRLSDDERLLWVNWVLDGEIEPCLSFSSPTFRENQQAAHPFLKKWDKFDTLVAIKPIERPFLHSGETLAFEISIGKRSEFRREGEILVFRRSWGEYVQDFNEMNQGKALNTTDYTSYASSALVVSVLDIFLGVVARLQTLSI